MSPFRELLKDESRFYWDETLEQLFQQSKAEILNSIQDGVRTFEINRPTCLITVWSRTGINVNAHSQQITFVDQGIGKLSSRVLDLPGPRKVVTRPSKEKHWL